MTQARQTVGQSPYRAFITREPFLFYEMRTTARLLAEGMTEDEAIERITRENLFQYPTERSLRGMARACVRRLRTLDSAALIEAIACQPQDVARQVCLYAMMREHRLVLDFMCGVIGEKYRQRDLTYSRVDLNVFFLRLQEQDDAVASWSDTTVTKLKQILTRILVENEYLRSPRADHLQPVLLSAVLERGMRQNGDEALFPAFDYFA